MQCYICEGDEEVHIHMPCNVHGACLECFRHHVETALGHDRTFPVRCSDHCIRASADEIASILRATGAEEDQVLADDYTTRARNYQPQADLRIECANADCTNVSGLRRLLDQSVAGNVVRIKCSECHALTCRHCRGEIKDGGEHTCEPGREYDEMKTYIASQPQDEQWKYQICWACRRWVQKSRDCNHMTCPCENGLCLICGRHWRPGQHDCPHGCVHMEDPVYDAGGMCYEDIRVPSTSSRWCNTL